MIIIQMIQILQIYKKRMDKEQIHALFVLITISAHQYTHLYKSLIPRVIYGIIIFLVFFEKMNRLHEKPTQAS
jgi:hypothetical protein